MREFWLLQLNPFTTLTVRETNTTDHIRSQPTSSLPADVLWGSFVTHSFLPHGERGEMNA